ncbi:MAG: hypothetical protein MJZ25_10030 [Fibrobacter sp.]|nr:hypothetical protein [Fibrobacter sp.]
MKKILWLFVISFLWGCSGDDSANIQYASDESEYAVQWRLNGRTLNGKLLFPSKVYVKEIKAFELDSNFNQCTELEVKGKYEIEKRNYKNRYVQFVIKAEWSNLDSGTVDIEFESIIDLLDVGLGDDPADLRLFSHLEVPRVMQLMKEGLPFDAAKKRALFEILSVYNNPDEMPYVINVSEKFKTSMGGYLKNNLVEFFPYFLFMYGKTDLEFVENVERFRSDFSTGSWKNFRDRVKSADYITKEWVSLVKRMDSWYMDVDDGLDYLRNVQEATYGIPKESRSGETFVIEDSTSVFYKDSLVCAGYGRASWRRDDGGYDTYAHNILRPFTDLEREIGACVFDSLKWGNKDTTVVEFEGETYKCSHQLDSSVPTKPDFENWKKVKSRK